MIRAFIVAAAIAAAAIAAAPVATAVGKYSNCTQGIRTGDTTSHREIPTTGHGDRDNDGIACES